MSGIIQKQILDITVSDKSLAKTYQDRFQSLYYTKLLPIMERQFEKYDTNERVIKIDALEFNLGKIDFNDFDRSLTLEFEKQLRLYLNNNSKYFEQVRNIDNIRVVSDKQSNIETLIFYLITGAVPWWHDKNKLFNLMQLWLDSITNNADLLLHEIKFNQSNTNFNKRLIKVFNKDGLFKSLHILSPQINTKVLSDIFTLLSTTINYLKFSETDLFGLFASTYISYIQQNTSPNTPNFSTESIITVFIKRIAQILNIAPVKFHRAIIESAIQNNKIINSTTNVIVRRIYENMNIDTVEKERLLQRIDYELLGTRKSNHSETELSKNKSPDNSRVSPNKSRVFNNSNEAIAETHQAKNDKQDISNIEYRKSNIGQEENNKTKHINEVVGKKNIGSNTISESQAANNISKIVEATKEFYIQHAGLVILWPFISGFFSNMKWVIDNKWQSNTAQQTAVIALQYIATGKDEIMEHECMLSKILCGMHYSDYVDTEIALDESIKSEAENMIGAAINRWSVMKGTSLNGFRTSFFNREGKLIDNESNWNLMIKRESFDVLLDKLPWPISVVKTVWMDKPIYVEW